MKILEDNWDYIQATARAKAVEIALYSGRRGDVDDFTQDLLCFLVKRVDRYNPCRSNPKTFISMILTYAKKDLLRRMYRIKRRAAIETVELSSDLMDFLIVPDYNSTRMEIREFIFALPSPDRQIADQILLQRQSIESVARQNGVSRQEILDQLRDSLRPLADLLGVKSDDNKKQSDDTSNEKWPRSTPRGKVDDLKGTPHTPFRDPVRGK